MITVRVPAKVCAGMFDNECGFEISFPNGEKISGLAQRCRVFVEGEPTAELKPGWLEVELVDGGGFMGFVAGRALLRFIPPDESFQTSGFRYPIDDLDADWSKMGHT